MVCRRAPEDIVNYPEAFPQEVKVSWGVQKVVTTYTWDLICLGKPVPHITLSLSPQFASSNYFTG